jgi:Ribosomally synthesized peptide in Herpetosiphon
MNRKQVNPSQRHEATPKATSKERASIFGLRYLEEEAAEIHDVVGCRSSHGTCTSCDDID